MSGLEAHFVVFYDEDTGRLLVDEDTAAEFLGAGRVYDTVNDEWENLSDHPGLDMKAGAALETALALYNDVLK